MPYFLAVLIFLFFLDAFFYFFPTKRNKEIKDIISDLQKLKFDLKYKKAVENNILFFRMVRSVFAYILWLIFVTPKLRKERENLLELADLPLPRWQKETHYRLIKLEGLKFPGLLKPVKNAVLKTLYNLKKKGPIILLNIGSGGMELERQIIDELLKGNFDSPIIFLCIELSPYILEVGLENINEFLPNKKVEVIKKSEINSQILNELKKEALKENKILIVLVDTDIFNLKETLSPQSIDIVYHSRFKHHLYRTEKENVDKLILYLSSKAIEFDDFYSIPVFIFPSIITWRWSVTLNGAILSYIRDMSKKELLTGNKKNWKIKIYNNLGYYLRIYDGAENKN